MITIFVIINSVIMSLSPKRLRFCEVYVADKELNGTKAYKQVYSVKSDSVANACAARLLANAKIKEKIKELMAERSKRTEITQDFVLRELAAVAGAKLTDFATIKTVERTRIVSKPKQKAENEENAEDDDKKSYDDLYEDVEETYEVQVIEVIDTDNMPEDKIGAISSVKPGSKGGIELKMNDKVKALELLARHLGMFEIDNKQKVDKILVGYTQLEEEENE